MTTVIHFLEPMMPHIIIASAAIGLFVVLGILILCAILFEKWYTRHGRRLLRAFLRFVGKPLLLSKRMAVRMDGAIASGLQQPGKLSSGGAVELMSGRTT